MHDGQPHPLLAQIPLTVSPFIALPTATTLPYTYKSLPSTLPPSSTGNTIGAEKPKYVTSSSGHAAHPEEIIASCKALQSHLQQVQVDAEKVLKEWEEDIGQRELAEKRRVAPGWLDRDEKILEPDKKSTSLGPYTGSQDQVVDLMDSQDAKIGEMGMVDSTESREGEELDRAFGGLDIR
ncbi:MAG: hypothetical protein M1830_000600 [Pleopsidium flavum]|nr:MAG: hypothetical protein M1830_000600 [Pleopsidium flavum]